MNKKEYDFTIADIKTIERIVSDDNVDINHVVLQKDDEVPEHHANSNVYLIIVRGCLTIVLNGEQNPLSYQTGHIINIPVKTKMHIYNRDDDILEFFIVKSPGTKK